jgi:hypothetical protein
MKLCALDVARRDPDVTDADFRILHAIVGGLDRDTEQTVRNRKTLAREAGHKSIRTVQNSVDRLTKRGLLIVHRGHGRGHTHVYEFPAREIYQRWMEQKGAGVAPFRERKDASVAPLSEQKKGQTTTRKGANDDAEKENQTTRYIPYRESLDYSHDPEQPRAAHQSTLAQVDRSWPSEGSKRGWWCAPFSPEFEAWLAYYTDMRWARAKAAMLSSGHSGRSVRVPSQWPPSRQRIDTRRTAEQS